MAACVTKIEKFEDSICFHCQSLGLSFSSVGRAMDSSSRGAGFDPRNEYVTHVAVSDVTAVPEVWLAGRRRFGHTTGLRKSVLARNAHCTLRPAGK